MKKLLLTAILAAACLIPAIAARTAAVSGRVIDEKGTPVAFATVVLLQAERQAAGMTTEADGRFVLKVPAGDYTLRIRYMGYETLTQPLHLTEGADLGDFVLRTSATEIEDVVVETQLIRREADRFVVDVANSPAAVGKDGIEMLKTAPGVWIDDEKISINGQGGSKVYVNERELKMEPAQLLAYLRTLRAEDIRKIEVIPVSGADFDADSSAGIIKITLKRRRDDGMEGSISYSTSQGEWSHSHSPNLRINYHEGRYDLYASAWGHFADERGLSREQTLYRTSDMSLAAESHLKERASNWGGKIGGIVELNPRHSLGAEFEYWSDDEERDTPSQTLIRQGAGELHNRSIYNTDDQRRNYSATLNWIVKLDTVGSTLKLLADYTRRSSWNDNDNRTIQTGPGTLRDSVYRDASSNRYDILTASLGWEKVFSPKWQLRTGAKYTRNDMRNGAEYRYLKDEAWLPSTVEDYRIDYTENIAALYAVASARLGRFGIVAGLRGEYTRTEGKGDGVKQDYFSLFPNANLSWSMDKTGKHSLILAYSRTIQRPGFWHLTPRRTQISDYTYQSGNPELEPAYNNQLNLTMVLHYKYSLTVGAGLTTDGFGQVITSDPDDPDKLRLTSWNFPDNDLYYASLSLPFQLTKWWSWNVNATAVRLAQRTEIDAPLERFNFFNCYTNMTFLLPAKFMLELSYFGQTTVTMGNLTVSPRHELNASIKKRFWKDRFTVSASVKNLLDRDDRFEADQPGFIRTLDVSQNWGKRSFQLRVSYNFKSGKSFRSRSVESSASEEKGRL